MIATPNALAKPVINSFPSIAKLLQLEENMRVQDSKLYRTAGKHPKWRIRPYVPVVTEQGVKNKQQWMTLGRCETMTKREAAAKRNAILDSINRRTSVVASQIPFGEFLDTWLKEFVLVDGNLASSTQDKYVSYVNHRISPAFGHLRMGEITTKRIDEWMASLIEDGIAYNTRIDLRNALSGIFTKARKWGLWKELNPAIDATVGKKRDKYQKRKLELRDLQRLLAALPNSLAMVCKLCLVTLRLSEVLGLQEKHLDFATDIIHVRQRLYRTDLSDPKSPKAVRDLPMGILAPQLRALCTGDPERFLFDWTYSNIQRVLRETAKSLGVYWPGFGFHTFRRMAKTGLGATGLDPFQVMRMAGHAHYDMSLLYTLTDEEAQRVAVETFQKKVLVQ